MTTRPLRVLLIEDSEDDALLLLEELRRGGYDVAYRRVTAAGPMRATLAEERWDIILSEFTLPSWDALGALAVLRETDQDLPFIIVSGTIREEAAVAALRAGAHDFLSKNQLARFLPVVARELGEADVRRARRRSDAELRAQERTYRRIVETAHEGIWMLGGDGRTSYANQRIAEMLGVTPPRLMGRAFLDFVGPESREAARLGLGRGDAEVPLSVRFVRRDGTDFWAALATNPITDEDGAPMGTLVMVADITERRRLQEQLMVSDRMASVGILAAGVAHEINNPLTAVLWNLTVGIEQLGHLRVEIGPNETLAAIDEGLRDAVEAAERVRDIARDLKVFSRTQDDVSTPVDVVRVIESSLRMARTEIRHRAQVRTRFAQIPPVLANESRLGQVFLNLIINAAHAIDEGAAADNELVIETGVDGRGCVFVEVRDTGAGMEGEVLDRLFTPFFTTKPAGVGTGLGLAICHRIVTGLGGDIHVTSTPGAGSVFRVTLPANATAEPAADAPSPAPAPPAPSRRGRVLAVDDEPMIIRILTRVVAADHDLTAFTRAQDALASIDAGERYDLILCDLMMPEMTGIELYESIATRDAEQAARMVFLTGGAFTPRAREFLDGRDNACISKPFDAGRLRALVNERLGRR